MEAVKVDSDCRRVASLSSRKNHFALAIRHTCLSTFRLSAFLCTCLEHIKTALPIVWSNACTDLHVERKLRLYCHWISANKCDGARRISTQYVHGDLGCRSRSATSMSGCQSERQKVPRASPWTRPHTVRQQPEKLKAWKWQTETQPSCHLPAKPESLRLNQILTYCDVVAVVEGISHDVFDIFWAHQIITFNFGVQCIRRWKQISH